MMETDFRTLLIGDATVAALIDTRVYPSTYPQAATNPAARYQKVTGATGLHMQGSDGLTTSLMQIDVRARSAASALAVRDAILAKLHAFAGIEGATDFRLIALRSDRGLQFEDDGATSYYSTSLDFDVTSRDAA